MDWRDAESGYGEILNYCPPVNNIPGTRFDLTDVEEIAQRAAQSYFPKIPRHLRKQIHLMLSYVNNVVVQEDFRRKEIEDSFDRRESWEVAHAFHQFTSYLENSKPGFVKIDISDQHWIKPAREELYDLIKKSERSDTTVNQTLYDYLTESIGLTTQVANTIVDGEPLTVAEDGTPSFSTNLRVETPEGKRLFFKLHKAAKGVSAYERAVIEAQANVVLGRLAGVQGYVPGTITTDVIDFGTTAMSVQNEIDPRNCASLKQLIDAYGKVTANSSTIANAIALPNSRVFSYERITDQIPKSLLSTETRNKVATRFTEGIEALTGDLVILADAKMDNHYGGRLVDLERMCIGNPAETLALLLLQNNALGHVEHYAKQFAATAYDASKESVVLNIAQLASDTTRLAFPLAMQELGGLCSRESTPEVEYQKDQLVHYLTHAR